MSKTQEQSFKDDNVDHDTISEINNIKNTSFNSNSISLEQNLESAMKIYDFGKSRSESRIEFESKTKPFEEKNSDTINLKNTIEIYNLKNIVKQSVDGLNDILNSKNFNNSLKKEKFINFEPIYEIEEDFEVKNSKLNNNISQKPNLRKSIEENKIVSNPNKNIKKIKTNPLEKSDENVKIIKPKVSITTNKIYSNRNVDLKKSLFEISKPKNNETSELKIKKVNDEFRGSNDFNIRANLNLKAVKDRKNLYKVEIDYNKNQYKSNNYKKKQVIDITNKKANHLSKSPELVLKKPSKISIEEKIASENTNSPYKIYKESRYTPKTLKSDKVNPINQSFGTESLKRDISSKNFDKQKSLKNTISSRNKSGLLQTKDLTNPNNSKPEIKNFSNSKILNTQKTEKNEINVKRLLELIYILYEISNIKETNNANHLRNSYCDLNKIFKSYFENTEEESNKNNSLSNSFLNISYEKRRSELNKRRDEKKMMHILIIQRNWRNYKLKKTLNVKENLLKFNKNEIIRMCKNSLIENLLKCDQFKVIINLITQTLSLWNDFLKVPNNTLTKTNIINFRNENLNENNTYNITLSKFITNVLKLNKSMNDSNQNNDSTIDNKEKSVLLLMNSEKKSSNLLEKSKI